MPVVKSRFEIDGGQAVRTINDVQRGFLAYNTALGQVVTQQATFTKGSKSALQTFVQINDAGLKTTSIVKSTGAAYEVLSTKVGQATTAQRKQAQALREQAKLADDIARQISGTGPRRKGAPLTTGISAIDPSKIGRPGDFANITTHQAITAGRANRLTAPQIEQFVRIVEQSAKVKTAIGQVSEVFDKFTSKVNEAGKIAFATGIYRGISLISGALKEGISTAVDYTNQIGLIQTISQDSGESFDSWNAAIRRTADTLGVPVARVAKDAYDALSNQVIQTTQDFSLLETAIRLEQITGSQAGSGLNTLSSLINGLGVNANQASVLSDKLFAIIDIGKVNLEGLDKVLGRTTSLMKTAGASFDETAGALALLTQAGIDEQESTTLLNNLFSETIKPNKALSEQLEKMGFNTGELALKTLGLTGYLEALTKATAGTKDGLATFFPDIRGLRGAALLTQNLDGLQKAIDRVKNSQGEASKASAIVNNNPGQQLLQEQERLKNFFTNDIGVEAVKAAAKLTQSLGGVENILKTIVPVVTEVGTAIVVGFAVAKIVAVGSAALTAASAFGKIRTAVDLATAAQLTFQAVSLRLVASTSAIIALVVAAYIAGGYVVDQFKEKQIAAFNVKAKPIEIKYKETVEKVNTESSKRVLDFTSSTEQMTAKYGKFISEARKLNDQFAASAKRAFDKATNALQNSFDISLNYVRKIVNSIEAEEAKVARNLEKLSKGNADLREDIETRFYERNLSDFQRYAQERIEHEKALNEKTGGGGPVGSGLADSLRGIVDARQKLLQQDISNAFDTHDLERADALFKELIQTVDTYKSTLDGLGFHKINVNHEDERLTLDFMEKRRAYQLEQQADVARLESNSIEARKNLKELEDVYKNIAEFGDKVFDKKSGKLTEDYKDKPTTALADLIALQNKAKEVQDTISHIGGDRAAQGRASKIFKDIIEEFDQQKKSLAQRLAGATNDDLLTKAAENRKTLAAEEIKTYSDLEAAQSKVSIQIAKNVKDLELYIETIRRVNASHLQNDNVIKGLFSPSTDQKTRDITDDALGKMLENLRGGKINAEELQKQFNIATPGIKAIEGSQMVNPADPSGAYTTIESGGHRIQDAISGLTASKSLLKDLNSDIGTFKQVVESIDAKNLSALGGVIKDIGGQQANLEAATGATEGLTVATDNLTEALKLEAQAQAALNAARANVPKFKGGNGGAVGGDGGEAEGHASGGVVGSQGGFLAAFFSGKFAKGTDTIPAMLTRDEFVVRAPMARKFFSQLVAINSNQAPIYRSEGGSTSSNVNTSNYHIHVSGGDGSAHELAKTVTQAIRRAQSQGVIRS